MYNPFLTWGFLAAYFISGFAIVTIAIGLIQERRSKIKMNEQEWQRIRQQETEDNDIIKCPKCKGEDVTITHLCNEAPDHEEIEDCLVCNDCGYSDY